MIKEIQSKKVLTYHQQSFPTNWDLNPYRGCTVGCKYCFAQYSHKYLGLEDFFKDIIVKTNIAECLTTEMNKNSWKKEQIKIGGTTDLYQHIEKKYELLPKIYEVIKKYKNPIFIQTKSTLILRDFEIIKELSKMTTVDIATSISTFDELIRKVIEPGAAKAIERVEMLARFNGIARSTTLGFMPIIPLLSDTDENLETTFRLSKENGIDNVVTSFLFLRGTVKPKFFEVIKMNFPEIYPDFLKLYSNSNVEETYAKKINLKIKKLREKYQTFGSYKPIEINKNPSQFSLF
ncbi:MAG: SPL family radical SAM protein [Bacteroidia bacterium]